MNFLHDRIGQIGQDLADDLQARAPEIFVNLALDQHPERTTGKTEMRFFCSSARAAAAFSRSAPTVG
jgi:hypothetical protein